MGLVAIASPPCCAGSKAASFCVRVSLGSPMGLTKTWESCADTSTGWPTLKRADLATAAGMRTARLLPQRCTVRMASLLIETLMYQQVYTFDLRSQIGLRGIHRRSADDHAVDANIFDFAGVDRGRVAPERA